MSKSNVIVLFVVQQGLSSSEAAQKFGVSKRWVNKVLAKYPSGDLKAVQPLSKKPRASPTRTSEAMEDCIVVLRLELTAAGCDADPASIAARLRMAKKKPPAISTIRRIVDKHQLIVPQLKKRPRSSYIRFEAQHPYETWQSDFTHWKLADDAEVEILNFLGDH